MPRKRKTAKRRKIEGVDNWQLDFLLTGQRPDVKAEKLNPFKELDFTFKKWRDVWETVKNDPVVQRWKAEHGETYAEKNL